MDAAELIRDIFPALAKETGVARAFQEASEKGRATWTKTGLRFLFLGAGERRGR